MHHMFISRYRSELSSSSSFTFSVSLKLGQPARAKAIEIKFLVNLGRVMFVFQILIKECMDKYRNEREREREREREGILLETGLLSCMEL